MAYLRSLMPDLPRPVWLLQLGGLTNSFGNGIVLPFLIIYLHNVRGISLGVAGLVVATGAAAAVFFSIWRFNSSARGDSSAALALIRNASRPPR
jgi:hypothetical protein